MNVFVFISFFVISYTGMLIHNWRCVHLPATSDVKMNRAKLHKKHPIFSHILNFIVAIGLTVIFFALYLLVDF